METTLVVMAAGMGSRYGKGIKQLEAVGPNGEIIMDYAIHDAREAGFDRVVFIIRKELETEFRRIIGSRIEKLMPVAYAFQELDDLPDGFCVPKGRTKPWGTGQAVLACRGLVDTPFVVINADDYYGKEAFVKVHEFLVSGVRSARNYCGCMAGFILGNTLSENGAVTRGICKVEDGKLISIEETGGIERRAGGVICQRKGRMEQLDEQAYTSMNMWGLTPEFMEALEKRFAEFLQMLEPEQQLKEEYLLPVIIQQMLAEKQIEIQVLETKDKWFGVTYHEDKAMVVDAIHRLHARGIYPDSMMQ